MPEWVNIASSGGALGISLLFLYGFYKGWWRTSFEVISYRERTEFLEEQVKRIIPALEKLTELTQLNSDAHVRIEATLGQILKILIERK